MEYYYVNDADLDKLNQLLLGGYGFMSQEQIDEGINFINKLQKQEIKGVKGFKEFIVAKQL